jgi:hypothetical protein
MRRKSLGEKPSHRLEMGWDALLSKKLPTQAFSLLPLLKLRLLLSTFFADEYVNIYAAKRAIIVILASVNVLGGYL